MHSNMKKAYVPFSLYHSGGWLSPPLPTHTWNPGSLAAPEEYNYKKLRKIYSTNYNHNRWFELMMNTKVSKHLRLGEKCRTVVLAYVMIHHFDDSLMHQKNGCISFKTNFPLNLSAQEHMSTIETFLHFLHKSIFYIIDPLKHHIRRIEVKF